MSQKLELFSSMSVTRDGERPYRGDRRLQRRELAARKIATSSAFFFLSKKEN